MKSPLFAVLVCMVAACHASSWVDTVYTSTLSGNQVVPDPGSATAHSQAIIVFDRFTNPKTFDVEIQSNIRDILSIDIRAARRGQVGTLLYSFQGSLTAAMRQIFRLSNVGNITVDMQEDMFLNGLMYIEVTTSGFAGGIVRGQIEHQDRLYARMSSEATVPISTSSSGRGLLFATLNEKTNQSPGTLIAMDVVHSVVNPLEAELHTGAAGTNGAKIHTTEKATSPIHEQVYLTQMETNKLFSGLTYFQVSSVANPDGDIRGQIYTIDQTPRMSFSARLTADQVAEDDDVQTNAVGCALVSFDCDTYVMEYMVMHDVEKPVQIIVGAARPGENGPLQFTLPRPRSPIFGSKVLSDAEAFLLYDQVMYFLVQSVQYPRGELRGQINLEYDWFAYMSGVHALPPVTTASLGCALFKLTDDNRRLNYHIVHSVPDALFVEMLAAPAGQNAFEPQKQFKSNRIGTPYQGNSPMIGDELPMDDDDLYNLVDDRMYMAVITARHPTGAVRGQVYRLDPCSVGDDDDDEDDGVQYPPVTPEASSMASTHVFNLYLMVFVLCGLSVTARALW